MDSVLGSIMRNHNTPNQPAPTIPNPTFELGEDTPSGAALISTIPNHTFELGEDAPSGAALISRQLQEAAWSSTVSDARVQLSQREQLLSGNVRTQMLSAIKDYHLIFALCSSTTLFSLSPEILRIIVEYAIPGAGGVAPFVLGRIDHIVPVVEDEEELKSTVIPPTIITPVAVAAAVAVPIAAKEQDQKRFRICIRPRPLLSHETDADEYSVVDSKPPTTREKDKGKTILIHAGKVGRSGNRLSMTHKIYHFDRVYTSRTSALDVGWDVLNYNSRSSASTNDSTTGNEANGSGHTVLFYGQTGTGKTCTFAGVLECLASILASWKAGESEGDDGRGVVKIEFIEIHGKKCYDLLSNRKQCKLLSDSSEVVHVRGATSFTLPLTGTPSKIKADFLDMLKAPIALRSSKVTERNPLSSRSHSVFTVDTGNSGLWGGKLRLVDLAGSERKYETKAMSAVDHRESAEINTALMALKDCIRAHHDPSLKPPFRRSLLTRVLRDCFTAVDHMTTIIATVSPTTTDASHTLNSLNHVALMQVVGPDEGKGVANEGTKTGAGVAGISEVNGVIESLTIDIPLCTGLASLSSNINTWTPSEVRTWISVADGGRFSHVVLPAGLSGDMLMGLNEGSLSSLFEGVIEGGEARGVGEGGAWVVGSGDGDDGGAGDGASNRRSNVLEVGRALFGALRMEQTHARATEAGISDGTRAAV